MKYYSEKLKEAFDTEKECIDAEKEYDLQNKKKEAIANKENKEKKEMAKAIDVAEQKVNEARADYKIAQSKAAEILEKSNAEVEKILKDAEDKIREAESDKFKKIAEFNKKFGVYTKRYTGDVAADEFQKALDAFNSSFVRKLDWLLRF